MSKRPVLRNVGGGTFEVTVDNDTFRFDDFPEARQVVEIASRPEVEVVFTCGWLYEAVGFEGETVVKGCEAPAFGTASGFTCLHGHGHVNADVRQAEGWDYVDDDELEAYRTGAAPAPTFEPVSVSAHFSVVKVGE